MSSGTMSEDGEGESLARGDSRVVEGGELQLSDFSCRRRNEDLQKVMERSLLGP